MAITVVGTGSNQSKTAGTTFTLGSANIAVEPGDTVIAVISSDNLNASTPTVSGIAGGAAGTWGQRATFNALSATAAAGSRTSVWRLVVTDAGDVGLATTITLSASVAAKAAAFIVFRGVNNTTAPTVTGTSNASSYSTSSITAATGQFVIVGAGSESSTAPSITIRGTADPADTVASDATSGGSSVTNISAGLRARQTSGVGLAGAATFTDGAGFWLVLPVAPESTTHVAAGTVTTASAVSGDVAVIPSGPQTLAAAGAVSGTSSVMGAATGPDRMVESAFVGGSSSNTVYNIALTTAYDNTHLLVMVFAHSASATYDPTWTLVANHGSSKVLVKQGDGTTPTFQATTTAGAWVRSGTLMAFTGFHSLSSLLNESEAYTSATAYSFPDRSTSGAGVSIYGMGGSGAGTAVWDDDVLWNDAPGVSTSLHSSARAPHPRVGQDPPDVTFAVARTGTAWQTILPLGAPQITGVSGTVDVVSSTGGAAEKTAYSVSGTAVSAVSVNSGGVSLQRVIAAPGTELRRNVFPNPRPTTTTHFSGTAGAVTLSNVPATSYGNVVRSTRTTLGNYRLLDVLTAANTPDVGSTYRMAFVIRSSEIMTGVNVYYRPNVASSAGQVTVWSNGTIPAANAWYQLTFDVTIPAGGGISTSGLSIIQTGSTVGATLDIGQILVEKGAGTTAPFFDGASTDTLQLDYQWVGTINDSASVALEKGQAINVVSRVIGPPRPGTLLAEYGFNEGSGQNIAGSGPQALALEGGTAFWTASGVYGSALGDDTGAFISYLYDPLSTPIVNTDQTTHMTWMYLRDMDEQPELLWGSTGIAVGFSFGQLKFVGRSSTGSWTTITFATTMPLNTWTHIAYTVLTEEGVANLYVNGVLTETQTFVPYTPSSVYPTVVHTGNSSIDDWRVFDGILTQPEIAYYMDKNVGEPDTINYPVTGTVAGTGAVSGTPVKNSSAAGTVISISTVSGTPYKLTSVTGTGPAVSTTTGTPTKRTAVSGTVAGVGATAGAPIKRTAASGTVVGVSVISGAPTKLTGVSGVVVGTGATVGTVTGTLGASGTVTAVSTTAGAAAPILVVSGTVSGVGGTAGTADKATQIAGIVAGVSAVTGTVGAGRPVSGVIAAASASSSAEKVKGHVYGTLPIVSVVSGTINYRTLISGVSTALGVITGTVTKLTTGSGVDAGTSTVSGSVSVALVLSGVVAAVAESVGQFTLLLQVMGESIAQGTASGSVNTRLAISGTVAGTSTNSGALVKRTSVAGTVAGISTTSAAPTKRTRPTGSITGSSATSGTLTARLAVSGEVDAFSDTSADPYVLGAIDGLIEAESTSAGSVISGSSLLAPSVVVISDTDGAVTARYTVDGEVTGEAVISGDPTAAIKLTGTVAGTSATSATPTKRSSALGTVVSISTVAGVARKRTQALGTVAAISTVSANLSVPGEAAGTIPTSSATNGTIGRGQSVTGAVIGVSDVDESMSVSWPLDGWIVGTVDQAGTVTFSAAISATSAATSAVVSGGIRLIQQALGLVSGVSEVAGLFGIRQDIAGTVNAVSTAVGLQAVLETIVLKIAGVELPLVSGSLLLKWNGAEVPVGLSHRVDGTEAIYWSA